MTAIGKFQRKNGGLANLFPLISWVRGDTVITLDGDFTSGQLRAMADHMERHTVTPRETRWPWPYLAPPD